MDSTTPDHVSDHVLFESRYKKRSFSSRDFYITISKTNQQLRSFARFGWTKLRNSIPAEIRCFLFCKPTKLTLKHLLLSKDKRNLVKTVKTFTRFSLYLGARFYFDLKLISAFCKFLVIIIIFFLFISEKFIYLSIYSFIYLDFQRIKTYLIGLYPPRLTLLFAVSAVCEFSSKIMNKLDRFVCDLCSVMARRLNGGFHRKIIDTWSVFQQAMFDYQRVSPCLSNFTGNCCFL